MNPHQATNSQDDQGACSVSGTFFQYVCSDPSCSETSFSARAEATSSHDDRGQSQDRPLPDLLAMPHPGGEPHHHDKTQQVQQGPFSHLLQSRCQHLHWDQDVASYHGDAPRARRGLDHPLSHLQAHRRPTDHGKIGPLHRRRQRMFGQADQKRCVSNLRRERVREDGG